MLPAGTPFGGQRRAGNGGADRDRRRRPARRRPDRDPGDRRARRRDDPHRRGARPGKLCPPRRLRLRGRASAGPRGRTADARPPRPRRRPPTWARSRSAAGRASPSSPRATNCANRVRRWRPDIIVNSAAYALAELVAAWGGAAIRHDDIVRRPCPMRRPDSRRRPRRRHHSASGRRLGRRARRAAAGVARLRRPHDLRTDRGAAGQAVLARALSPMAGWCSACRAIPPRPSSARICC